MLFTFDLTDAAQALSKKLAKHPAFASLAEQEREQAVLALVQLDLRFMEDTGVDRGEPYDEDAGFNFLVKGLKRTFPALDAEAAADAFTDVWDAYLEEQGALEWE